MRGKKFFASKHPQTRSWRSVAVTIFIAGFIQACSSDSPSGSAQSATGNSAPVAVINDTSGTTGDTLELDGTQSSDPDGDPLSYTWTLTGAPNGSTAVLTGTSSPTPSFIPDTIGTYVVELQVTDDEGAGDTESKSVSVNEPGSPVAHAGADQNVLTSSLVRLNGSGSRSPSSSLLSYSWTLEDIPNGSSATLVGANSVSPTFTADLDGEYIAALVVSDNNGTSVADQIVVTASSTNSVPVANAGVNQIVGVGATVQLDGTASSDANGDLLSYTWQAVTLPSGSSASLNSINSPNPTFVTDVSGQYRWRLVVNDGQADSTADDVVVTANASNVAPVADAGPNQNARTGTTVVLDGSGSSDPDGGQVNYAWSFVSQPVGSNVALSNSGTVNPSFTPGADGTYVIELVVDDGELNSNGDRMVVTASSINSAPNANAGPNQNVTTGDLVSLNGTNSNDPDGDPLSYAWSLASKPSSSSAALTDAASARPTFTADRAGTYVIQLLVDDGSQTSDPDTVHVVASDANSAPTANAGANFSVGEGDFVQLDGSSSSDVDGDSLSYTWSFTSRPSGSSASLSGSSSVNPSFTADVAGNYVVQLTVSDGQLSSNPDSVTVTAQSQNSAPNANAGSNQSVQVGDWVTLNGTASSDPDGDLITYSWNIVSAPSGSNAALDDNSAAQPSFTADVSGTFVIQLIVSDGFANSTAAQTNVTASSGNQAPVANAGGDQSVDTGDTVNLNGGSSSDGDGDLLSYAWSFVSRPAGSSATLSGASSETPSFVADVDGTYTVRLVVNDSTEDSSPDNVTVNSSPVAPPVTVSDDFSGNGALIDYTTYNGSAVPNVARSNGRYRAEITNNSGEKTLWYEGNQGRADVKLVSFPFEYIARNVGIGTVSDSQQPPSHSNDPVAFAGVMVHVTDMSDRNYSFLVVGHRQTHELTVEAKNTRNGSSVSDDAGTGAAPLGRADLRIIGHSDRTLTAYWQQPNPNPGAQADNWQLYRGDGDFPGPAPSFGSSVYVGLITYTYQSKALPFVGTADSVELVGE